MWMRETEPRSCVRGASALDRLRHLSSTSYFVSQKGQTNCCKGLFSSRAKLSVKLGSFRDKTRSYIQESTNRLPLPVFAYHCKEERSRHLLKPLSPSSSLPFFLFGFICFALAQAALSFLIIPHLILSWVWKLRCAPSCLA